MNATLEATGPMAGTVPAQPCCLAISAVPDLAQLDSAGDVRAWRALSLDRRTVLGSGELLLDGMEPLAILRERAAEAARERGFEPRQFILEQPGARA